MRSPCFPHTGGEKVEVCTPHAWFFHVKMRLLAGKCTHTCTYPRSRCSRGPATKNSFIPFPILLLNCLIIKRSPSPSISQERSLLKSIRWAMVAAGEQNQISHHYPVHLDMGTDILMKHSSLHSCLFFSAVALMEGASLQSP